MFIIINNGIKKIGVKYAILYRKIKKECFRNKLASDNNKNDYCIILPEVCFLKHYNEKIPIDFI